VHRRHRPGRPQALLRGDSPTTDRQPSDHHARGLPAITAAELPSSSCLPARTAPTRCCGQGDRRGLHDRRHPGPPRTLFIDAVSHLGVGTSTCRPRSGSGAAITPRGPLWKVLFPSTVNHAEAEVPDRRCSCLPAEHAGLTATTSAATQFLRVRHGPAGRARPVNFVHAARRAGRRPPRATIEGLASGDVPGLHAPRAAGVPPEHGLHCVLPRRACHGGRLAAGREHSPTEDRSGRRWMATVPCPAPQTRPAVLAAVDRQRMIPGDLNTSGPSPGSVDEALTWPPARKEVSWPAGHRCSPMKLRACPCPTLVDHRRLPRAQSTSETTSATLAVGALTIYHTCHL